MFVKMLVKPFNTSKFVIVDSSFYFQTLDYLHLGIISPTFYHVLIIYFVA